MNIDTLTYIYRDVEDKLVIAIARIFFYAGFCEVFAISIVVGDASATATSSLLECGI
jgi:hypothetical protein